MTYVGSNPALPDERMSIVPGHYAPSMGTLTIILKAEHLSDMDFAEFTSGTKLAP
jgi:hypothetical protein